MKENLTYYELSRYWFEFCNVNFDIIKPIHSALYFYLLNLNNKLNNPDSMNLPKEFAMQSIGVSNWRTYSNALENLVDWGFVSVVSKAKNQSTATVIAVVKNTVAIKVCCCKKYSSKYNGTVDIINDIATNVSIPLKLNVLNTLSETCVREDEGGKGLKEIKIGFGSFKGDLLNEQIWIGGLESTFKLSIIEIKAKLEEFHNEMLLRGEESSIEKMGDAKRRFFFWLKNPKGLKTESKRPKNWKRDLMQSTLDECNQL